MEWLVWYRVTAKCLWLWRLCWDGDFREMGLNNFNCLDCGFIWCLIQCNYRLLLKDWSSSSHPVLPVSSWCFLCIRSSDWAGMNQFNHCSNWKLTPFPKQKRKCFGGQVVLGLMQKDSLQLGMTDMEIAAHPCAGLDARGNRTFSPYISGLR